MTDFFAHIIEGDQTKGIPNMTYQISTQRDLRAAFWETKLEGKRGAKNSRGEYSTDINCEWCDFIDYCARDGIISEALAQRATL